jgi:hypothetical protein
VNGYLSLVLWLAISGTCRAAATNETNAVASPKASSVVIVLKDRQWTVDELNKVARSFVKDHGGKLDGSTGPTLVDIYPHDKLTMCRFTYSQGFGKPVWRVSIGFDGKILSWDKGIKLEEPPALNTGMQP